MADESWTRVEESRERKMDYFPWLVSCRLIRLNLGVGWGREKMSCAVTGKENMSRVSLGQWLYDLINC